MGYHRAFPDAEIVGVDIAPQPRYPFTFTQGDAMTYPLDGFDLIHASPPCQDHSSLGHAARGTGWMLAATVERLKASSTPWVVENVVGPSVVMDGWWFTLCGSMFGLQVRRHRRFGSSHLILPPPCDHSGERPYTITGHPGGRGDLAHHRAASASEGPVIMEMPWATWPEVVQAIPPAYTEFIGRQIADALERRASDRALT